MQVHEDAVVVDNNIMNRLECTTCQCDIERRSPLGVVVENDKDKGVALLHKLWNVEGTLEGTIIHF